MDSKSIYTINNIGTNISLSSTRALEKGLVIYLPEDGFICTKEDAELFTDQILAPKEKNISYQIKSKKLSGIHKKHQGTTIQVQAADMMQRFAEYSKSLISTLFPKYEGYYTMGRTSYRPAQVANRRTSLLKDDSKLHVDAFSSSPINGQRILRVFANINPHQQPRIWNIGESFDEVLAAFASYFTAYNQFKSYAMHLCRITKTRRSAYDHYMLELHNNMKLNEHYQNGVTKQNIAFPSNTSWIAYTDQVSHAALSGQFLLEQTFYLPVDALENKKTSPLMKLKKLMPDQQLIL